MCGVFGFVAKKDGGINVNIIKRIAAITEQRGPHAWGIAWINRNDRLCCYKQTGRVTDHFSLLVSLTRNAKMLIGHTRYATQGDPQNNLNNHPHACDGGWIVHNGVIPHYQDLISERDLHPVTDCDSETLALMIESHPSPKLLTRCVQSCDVAATRNLVMLGLWKPGKLVAVRMGNPLHVGNTKKGTYFASLADDLPNAQPIPDNEGFVFGLDS